MKTNSSTQMSSTIRSPFRAVILASASVLVLGATLNPETCANAQEATAARNNFVIEEITVTTRKRSERLQNVPIAISAFTAANIEAAGIKNVDDIARLTPGFTFAPLFGGDASTPVIRGLSTTIGEPNVGFFVDGVYQSSRAAMDALLSNSVERVEVAKGPQSALYGRNTFGGAINFVTKRPSNELEGTLELTGGDQSRIEARGSVGGPLIKDKLFARAAFSHFERNGFYTNELTGDDLDSRNTEAYAVSLEALPSEDLDIVLRASYENTNDGDDPLRFVPNNARPFDPTGAGLPPAFQLFEGKVPSYTDGFAVTPGFFKRDNFTASLSIDWDVGDYTLTSITGYNDLDTDRNQDNDFEARSIRYLMQSIDQYEFSQEFRITSPQAYRLRWMLGAYYYHLDTDTTNNDQFVGIAAGLGGLLNETEEKTDSYAIFGQLDFDVSETVTLSFSGRYTSETKKAFAKDTDPLTMASSTFDDKADFDNFTPRVSLDYQLTEDALLYASIARAIKTGGFNVVTATGAILDEERTYDPEKSWHYEIGAKTTLVDGRVTFNIAGFYIDWKDQIVRALGQTFAVLNANAGKTTSKGIEAELVARPVEGLELTGGFAYTDSAYDDYFFGALLGLGFNPAEAELAGTQLQYVSKYTANGSIQYRQPIMASFEWFGRADVSYQSKQSIVQTADAYVGERTLVNLRTGIENDRYGITFWVDNVFDNDAAITGAFITNQAKRFDFSAGLAGLGPIVGFEAFGGLITSPVPRTWGVTLRAKF